MSFKIPNPDGAGAQVAAGEPGQGTPDPATIGTGGQQPTANVATPAAQPGSTAQPEPKAGEGSLTLDDIRKAFAETAAPIVREEVSKAFRGIQSANAKLEERVKKEFQQQVETLTKVGMTPTEAQAQALLDQTRVKVLSEAEPAGNAAPSAGAQPASGEQKPQGTQPEAQHPAVLIAQQMIKNAGLEKIDPNSPSYKLINQETDDPAVFIQSVQSAIDAEVTRLQIKDNTRARNPATAAGLGKSIGSGIANITDPTELLKRGLGVG